MYVYPDGIYVTDTIFIWTKYTVKKNIYFEVVNKSRIIGVC